MQDCWPCLCRHLWQQSERASIMTFLTRFVHYKNHVPNFYWLECWMSARETWVVWSRLPRSLCEVDYPIRLLLELYPLCCPVLLGGRVGIPTEGKSVGRWAPYLAKLQAIIFNLDSKAICLPAKNNQIVYLMKSDKAAQVAPACKNTTYNTKAKQSHLSLSVAGDSSGPQETSTPPWVQLAWSSPSLSIFGTYITEPSIGLEVAWEGWALN